MVETKDIIKEFMKIKLEQRGHTEWIKYNLDRDKGNKRQKIANKNNNNDVKQKDEEELKEICQILDKISDALLDFIKNNRSQNDLITNMSDQLVDNFQYENFEALADEIFAEGITWSHIVTTLIFCFEWAYKVQEIDTDDVFESNEDHKNDHKNNERILRRKGEMVYELIDWMTKYFREKLDDWISEQSDGWLSMKVLKLENLDNSKSNLKQYFGVAAFAVLISTIYFCSKF